jgi:transketolase
MFAAHHQLANLIAIVDLNGQQALGPTARILDLAPLARRWESFGWDVHEVDGHDAAAIAAGVSDVDTHTGRPRVLLASTVFGKGVSYMERQLKWHYWPMSETEYRQALDEVKAAR